MSDLPARVVPGYVAVKATSWLLPLALPMALAACDGIFDSQVCTLNIAPGITVTITDSVSGEPRAAEAVAVARERAYVDTLDPAVSIGDVLISRQGAYERKGIYEVTVRAPGYRDWVRSGVFVRPGDCHVQQVELQAPLQTVPPQ